LCSYKNLLRKREKSDAKFQIFFTSCQHQTKSAWAGFMTEEECQHLNLVPESSHD
jgi:hypothetical protein